MGTQGGAGRSCNRPAALPTCTRGRRYGYVSIPFDRFTASQSQRGHEVERGIPDPLAGNEGSVGRYRNRSQDADDDDGDQQFDHGKTR